MSTGKDNKTLPITPEYADGYERTFGKREPIRGKWIQDPVTGEMVDAAEYRPPEKAVDAPIMVDRWYEGATIKTVDEKGKPLEVDIGSRRKHRTYLRDHGLTTTDDYDKPGGQWDRQKKEREEGTPAERRELRDLIGRIDYGVEKKNARRR